MEGIKGIFHIFPLRLPFAVPSCTFPPAVLLLGERRSTEDRSLGLEVSKQKKNKTKKEKKERNPKKSAENPETFPIRFDLDPPLDHQL